MAELDPLGPILGVLFEDGSSDYVLRVLGLAGIPTHFELSTEELYSHNTRKRAYRSRLAQVFAKFSEPQRIQVAENIARELGSKDPTRARLEGALRNVGWAVSEGKLIPIAQVRASASGGNREGGGQPAGLRSSAAEQARVPLEENVEATATTHEPASDKPRQADLTRRETGSNARTSAHDQPTEPAATAPSVSRVFVSYSWDSEEHKGWALALATRLRGDGIDAIIDQTHLALGARSPEFMERSVRDSGCVLVVCTEIYKQRFDNREGGAGYEGHIITGEIINEVGENKFIPVLRSGEWKSAVPTALQGIYGVDLRRDSADEYRRLVKRLHGACDIPSVGPRPEWLYTSFDSSDRPAPKKAAALPDLREFVEQRKGLPDSVIVTKIWSKPRWRIWICPTEFKRARFQNLEQCREFMLSSYVCVQGWFPYPWFSADSLETGNEWIAGEIDWSEAGAGRVERWVLFRSGQFVHNRALDEIPRLGDQVHVLEILDTTTGAFELAARMAHRGVLFPEAVVVFELQGVDGRGLTWPADILGGSDLVAPVCWCQEEGVTVWRRASTGQLEARRRDYALEVALEIYARFGWSDPPKQRLREEQDRRFGGLQQGQG